MELISIIIPVYNVEKYLAECVESVLHQSYENLEILLIDDGSDDHSGEICEKYKYVDKVTVYHKKNGGLSSARNYGIERAKGEYFSFIDSDDKIDKYFIERLYAELKKNSDTCKISMCKFTRKENDFSAYDNKPRIISSQEVLFNILYQKNDHLFSVAAWNKLYHRSIFENIRYKEDRLNEDMFVICETLSQTENVSVLDYKGYYYRINSESITQKKFAPKNMDVIEACDHILSQVEKIYNSPEMKTAAVNLKFRRSYQMLYKIWLSGESYDTYENNLFSFIKKNKSIILMDKNSLKSSKFVAVMSIFGKPILKIITKIFYGMKGK